MESIRSGVVSELAPFEVVVVVVDDVLSGSFDFFIELGSLEQNIIIFNYVRLSWLPEFPSKCHFEQQYELELEIHENVPNRGYDVLTGGTLVFEVKFGMNKNTSISSKMISLMPFALCTAKHN